MTLKVDVMTVVELEYVSDSDKTETVGRVNRVVAVETLFVTFAQVITGSVVDAIIC